MTPRDVMISVTSVCDVRMTSSGKKCSKLTIVHHLVIWSSMRARLLFISKIWGAGHIDPPPGSQMPQKARPQ